MPRIPDELIERIERNALIAALARRAGVEARKHGKIHLGRCLLHVELKGGDAC